MPDVYIAIVSGRSVANVKQMVGIQNVTYAGNHGLEIEHPDGTKFVHPMPVAYEEKVGSLLKELQEEVMEKLYNICWLTFLIKLFSQYSYAMMERGLKTRAPF